MKQNHSVLIVEDSFIVALHLQSALESEGYEVTGTFSSGEDALQSIEHKRPDLVLMDIMLNGKKDGIETTQILKSKYSIPVIYITALTDKETIQRAKYTEPHGYLTKPFEDREIFTVIEMALYKHAMERRLKESEEKYFSTVKSISDAVIVIDKNFIVTYINPAACSLLQFTKEEVSEKKIMDLVHLLDESGNQVEALQCKLGVSSSSAMPDNLTLLTKLGTKIPIGESSLSVMLDPQDNLAGLIMIFRDLTVKKEHEKLLREIEKQRIAFLIEGQEKERSRIAKDLHDGLGQMLNAIKMNASVLIEDKRKAVTLDKMLDEAIQESIRISENLLPSKLKDFNLTVCLKSLCKSLNESGNVPIQFESDDEIDIDQSRKVNFYRITQEALTNAIKHAQATEISVHLTKEPENVRLKIKDNGKGINPVVDNKIHSGLINIKERTDLLDGKISIESLPDQGTLIVIAAPLYRN